MPVPAVDFIAYKKVGVDLLPLNYSLLEELLEQGCVGLINYVPLQYNARFNDYFGGHGTPVKIKIE